MCGPLLAPAQQEEKKPPEQPQVRVNIMNVCAPPDAERKEIAAALEHIPSHPRFSGDFEVSRGRTTLDKSPARWVRVRHDFAPDATFTTAQYSFSDDGNRLEETLVVRPREGKDIVQISIEDGVSAGQPVSAVLASDTPPERIKVERFGKPSLGLDRCEGADQSAYQPLFRRAAEVMSEYRATMSVRRLVPAELARLAPPSSKKSVPKK
ncbi:MAG TPA: hypothetical protein VFU76_13090 [Terriglobales bacterium]|nr:hypothetical protein [Terriglobales bacterium]